MCYCTLYSYVLIYPYDVCGILYIILLYYACTLASLYHIIMQMVRGAKLSRLQGLAEIRGKAFAVV